MLNGWQSAQGDWNTGDPAYCVDHGIVYLSGSLKDPTYAAPWNAEFAVLPPQALPTSALNLLTYAYGGNIGALVVQPNGAMFAVGNGADLYTSLAGISFPVAGTALTPLPLYSGWQSGQSHGSGDPSYVINNGIVYWTGSLTTTQSAGPYPNYFADVPAAAHAGRCLTATVYTSDNDPGRLLIRPPSSNPAYATVPMAVNNPSGTNDYAYFTSLDNISYPVNGAANWQPLSLQNGWTASPRSPYCQTLPSAPSYYVQNHIAYLVGWIEQDSPGGAFLGTLPLPARPQHDLYLMAGPNGEYLHISPDGNMYAFGALQPNVVILDTIAYQTSS